MKVLGFFSKTMKDIIGVLMGIVLNLQIALDDMYILAILILPVNESAMSLYLGELFDFTHQCFIIFILQIFHLCG